MSNKVCYGCGNIQGVRFSPAHPPPTLGALEVENPLRMLVSVLRRTVSPENSEGVGVNKIVHPRIFIISMYNNMCTITNTPNAPKNARSVPTSGISSFPLVLEPILGNPAQNLRRHSDPPTAVAPEPRWEHRRRRRISGTLEISLRKTQRGTARDGGI